MSGESAPGILIEGAHKTYQRLAGLRRREAVRGVSLCVERGTVHGLLGPNGAGKTTTLKMLLGLVHPTAGRFEIRGSPSCEPNGRMGLGFLPEQPYFPVQLTADQAMLFYGRLVGVTRRGMAEEVPRLLGLVGLQGQGQAQLSRFSRGMLQRLGIAQSLLGDPEVIVLDEPASGLDPVGQRDVRNLMLALRSEGKTVLLSSHQLSEVEVVCDKVTILDRGSVAAEGRLDDLLNVAGRVSVRTRGLGAPLPAPLAALSEDVAASGSTCVFSIREEAVRDVVDMVYASGGLVESLAPKRESLEDYFARLLQSPDPESPAGLEEVA